MLTDNECWALVEEINWGEKYKEIDTTNVKFGLALRLGEENSEVLRAFVNRRVHEMMRAVEKYERKIDKTTGLGDDSFSDLTSHIVGMGRATFEDYLQNPEKAFQLGVSLKFGESLFYCIPFRATVFEIQNLVKWRDEIKESLDAASKFESLAPIAAKVWEVVSTVENSTLTKNEANELWNRLLKEVDAANRAFCGTSEERAVFAKSINFLMGWSHRNYVSDRISLRGAFARRL